jgi:predicted PurR-regulated permease PerM
MRKALTTVWANPYVRVAVGAAILGLLVATFVAVQPAGSLFLTALGLAYLLNPVVDWLQARRVHRRLAVALVALVLIAVASAVTSLGVVAVRNTLTESDGGITLSASVTTWFERLPANLERLVPDAVYEAIAEPLATLGDLLRQAIRALSPYLERIGAGVYDVVSGTVAGVAFFLLVLVLTVYVLHDYHRFVASLLHAWPEPVQPAVRSVARTFDRAVGGYVRGQLVIAVAVGGMIYLGLAIVGLPFAGVIGVLAGLLNVVPYLGTIVPAVPALVIAVAGGWWQVLFVLVVFVVTNQIDNHVLTPQILSRSTRLHPVTVIVAIIGGFALGGLVTAIFAVPLVAFAKAVYTEHYLGSRFYREG